MKKKIILIAVICISAHLHIHTFAQVANGTGAGNALSFNGSNNYVECGMASQTFDAITVEAWVKFNSISSGVAGIVTRNNGMTLGDGWNLDQDVPGVRWGVKGNGLVFAHWTTDPTPGIWYHIAGTYDKDAGTNNVKLYVNGMLVGQSTETGVILASPVSLYIGKYSVGYFNGQIDEVRIYNRALTETEVRATMCKKLTGTENGLMGYWRFDEGSGSTVYDASPSGNNGTLH